MPPADTLHLTSLSSMLNGMLANV